MSKLTSANKLQDAVRKLEAFACQMSKKNPLSRLSKTISLVRSLWISPNTIQEKDELLHAVETINRERMQIQKLQAGDPAEQKLAASLTAVIDNYNKHVQKSSADKGSMANFLSHRMSVRHELPSIHLPQQLTVTYRYSQETIDPNTKCAINAIKPLGLVLSKQSAELFHMKVLALLEKYGIASNPEARNIVKQAPIQTCVQQDNQETCTLTQTLTLFPGQTVVVKGTSALDPKTQTISRLFPSTFSIFLESTQTGFPHPSQRNGWSLANQLMPDCPQRMDLLSHTASIFLRKKQAILDLAPQGSKLPIAKQLLKNKKQAFHANQQEYIDLLRKVMKKIIQKAPKLWIVEESDAIIDRYYDSLASNPFDKIQETHQEMRDLFIVKPHQRLLEAILNGKATAFGSHDPDTRYRAAKEILENEFAQAFAIHGQHEYIHCLGAVIGRAVRPIILQYLSEDLIFAPPQLSAFEQHLQAMAYQHVVDFLDELSLPEEASKLLQKQLASDLAIMNDDADLSIPQELAQYFHKRFQSLIQL